MLVSRGCGWMVAVLACVCYGPAWAQHEPKPIGVPPATPAPPAASTATPAESWQDALAGGKFSFDLRLRYEYADQDGLDESHAATGRLRVGYATKALSGFSGFIELEGNAALDDDSYNAAGLNGEPDKTVIADPEDYELNQLYGRYFNEEYKTGVTVGRQRLLLDDERFIGSVGWRQLEQTFDAATFQTSFIDDVTATYSYLWAINRIFGPDADRDYDSDSHVLNIAYSGFEAGKIVAFAYLLDFEGFTDAAANSSNTVGLRFAGSRPLRGDLSVDYVASYAIQVDAGDHPTDYTAHYYLLEGTLKQKGFGSLGLGYEVLGSDDGEFAFRTPLATGHKFQGWADVFLATPNDGIRDLYIAAGTTLPYAIDGKLVYHAFWEADGGSFFGHEIDAILSKKITPNVAVLGKAAYFEGNDDEPFADIVRLWVQTEIKF